MKSVLRTALFAVVAGVACGKKEEPLPDSIAALREVAVRDRDAANAARWAKQPKKAEEAAAHAVAASKKAGELLAKTNPPQESDVKARGEAAAAAREAQFAARIAEEEKRLEEIRGGLKPKAYRAGRKIAWPAACRGLAAAADQANGKDVESLPAGVRDSARVASDLALRCNGRQPLADGKPDWPGIASDMRGAGAAPPREASQDLAIAFMIMGKNEFALYELETTDPATLPTDEDKTAFHLVRGIIFSRLGMPLLAGEEISRAPAVASGGGAGYGPELLAGLHLALAFVYLQSKENELADREIALSIQAWPDNPLAVFLTGERQAADGDYEKAAGSMEEAAQGTGGEWLAKRLSERARQLRDHPGEGGSLVHDPAFQREVLFHYLGVAAKRSPAAAKVSGAVARAEGLGRAVLEKLPGGD